MNFLKKLQTIKTKYHMGRHGQHVVVEKIIYFLGLFRIDRQLETVTL